MISGVFLLNSEFVPIVAKYQKPPKDSLAIDTVCKVISTFNDPALFKPFFKIDNLCIYVKHSNEVWIAITIEGDGNNTIFLDILDQIEINLQMYLGKPLTDFISQENFALIYRVVDCFLDSSYPYLSDTNSLMLMLSKDGKNKGQYNPISPWRANGFHHSKQQILFDVTEMLDYQIGIKGNIENSQIRGEILCRAEVDGSPEMRLQFKNSPHFDDICFHRSVNYQMYRDTGIISCVPAEGQFKLAEYRLTQKITPPITVKATSLPSGSSMDIKLTITAEKEIRDLHVTFNVFGSSSHMLSCDLGNISQSGETIRWDIGRIKATKTTEMKGIVPCHESCRNITFYFSFACSGLTSGCDLSGIGIQCALSGDPTTAVKSETRAGQFQVRSGLQFV